MPVFLGLLEVPTECCAQVLALCLRKVETNCRELRECFRNTNSFKNMIPGGTGKGCCQLRGTLHVSQ